MDSCAECLMCENGRCCDPDSDFFGGPVPDVPCSLFEVFEQVCFDFKFMFWKEV